MSLEQEKNKQYNFDQAIDNGKHNNNFGNTHCQIGSTRCTTRNKY